VEGDRRRLHNEVFYDLYASPNIIKVMKLRRMRWEGIQGTRERLQMHTNFLLVNLKGRDHAEGLGVDGRIILE
jgi:hypothetical protein